MNSTFLPDTIPNSVFVRSIKQMVTDMKESRSFEIGTMSMARVAYYSGKYKIQDPYFRDIIENNMIIFKEQFSPRQSFGLFYGVLKLNYSKSAIHFFRYEYTKFEKTHPEVCYGKLISFGRDYRIGRGFD